jgi:hypothetical protein
MIIYIYIYMICEAVLKTVFCIYAYVFVCVCVRTQLMRRNAQIHYSEQFVLYCNMMSYVKLQLRTFGGTF